MDVNNIASLATAMSTQQTRDAIGIAVLKKVLEVQTSSTMTLINALMQTSPANNPPNLGNTIDTTA
ncbi:MAG TPA: YjfB family protein [Methylophilaceae bacterium]|jgi:hypothetical protein|nr:YjfB family protein [Methylophilaceae bacterium]